MCDESYTASSEAEVRSAAEAGRPVAMTELGVRIVSSIGPWPGRGVPRGGRKRAEEAARWFRQAAQGGHLEAMLMLIWLLERMGRGDERQTWMRIAAETGDPRPMRVYRDFLRDHGREEEYEYGLRRLAEAGDVPARWELGELLAWRGDIEEAGRWFGPYGSGRLRPLAVRLERAGRLSEAEHWYRRAMDGGDTTAAEYLALLLDEQGRPEEAARARRSAEEGYPRFRREETAYDPASAFGQGPDLATVATSVVLTTAIIPFVQGMLTKAGEETYAAVRRKLRVLFRKHSDDERAPGPDDLIVVKDPALPLRLRMRTDATDEALRALAGLDIPELAAGERPEVPATVAWDTETRSWRVARERVPTGGGLLRRSRRRRGRERW